MFWRLSKKKLKIRLNLEISVNASVLETAYRARPDGVTFVPEKREERTTESGLDAVGLFKKLKRVNRTMKSRGISVSLFVDPDLEQIRAARKLGVDAVEIHTGDYANATTERLRKQCERTIEQAVRFSNSLGLLTHVGHGLDYENVARIAGMPGIIEFNIGYSIISRSLLVGLPKAVRDMKRLIQRR